MKKFLAVTLSLVFALSLSACGFNSNNKTNSNGSTGSKGNNNVYSSDIISSPTSDTLNSTASENLISRDRAIELALNKAGLKQEDIRDLDAELDREINGVFWDINFESGGYEYSYDINAETEEITENRREIED